MDLIDYHYSKYVPDHIVAEFSDTQVWDYRSHHVYPDDAIDIKNHQFFHGIAWDRLHLSRPPFIPDVKSRDDTKYFDEDPISDVDDASSCYSAQGDPIPLAAEDTNLTSVTSVDTMQGLHLLSLTDSGRHTPLEKMVVPKYCANGEDVLGEGPKKAKERKRPRDRVLRDKDVGRKVLELRKKGAFLGYTYRRHTGFLYDEERRPFSFPRN